MNKNKFGIMKLFSKIFKIQFFLVCFLFLSGCQTNKYESLRLGTFELYENNHKVGVIYRKGKYQIEKYPTKKNLTKAKIEWIDNRTLLIKGAEKDKKGVDTITWKIQYELKNTNQFIYRIKAAYIDTLKYEHFGIMTKVSDTIPSNLKSYFIQ